MKPIFIITFGSGQLGGFGLYYHMEVEAPDEITARRIAGKAFEGHWCGIYKPEFNYPLKYGTQLLGRLVYENTDEYDTYYSAHKS